MLTLSRHPEMLFFFANCLPIHKTNTPEPSEAPGNKFQVELVQFPCCQDGGINGVLMTRILKGEQNA